MAWLTTKPESTDLLSELAGVVRAQKTQLDSALQHTMYWSDSTSSAGITRLSTITGSCRALVASESALSSNETGILFWASNVSRLYALGHGWAASEESSAVLVGSRAAIVQGSTGTVTANTRFLTQSGVVSGQVETATGTVTFGTAYAATAPTITTTPLYADVAEPYTVHVTATAAAGFDWRVDRWKGGPDPGGGGFAWRSVGTVAVHT
jgi:hypothetical protein